MRSHRRTDIVLRTMRVLVVEDEKKVAKALREGLEAEHYDVRLASSGEEGFFLVNHETFDCVVLDLMLPHRDGDRKSTRLNSSHGYISYAVFCLKKKIRNITPAL